jgi:hypothetical protein
MVQYCAAGDGDVVFQARDVPARVGRWEPAVPGRIVVLEIASWRSSA